MAPMTPEDEQKARELLQTLTDLKEKTVLLGEHVENRKAALEEEIEESLHEAIANARDSLEKIYENIEPKLEKTIREKLDEIKKQMETWKTDAKRIVQQEIDGKSDDMGQILLDGLEARIQERTANFTQHMKKTVEEQVQQETETRVRELRGQTQKEIEATRGLTLTALGVAVLALIGAVVAMLI